MRHKHISLFTITLAALLLAITARGVSAASLTGSLTPVTSPQAFDLTALGTTSWTAWGHEASERSTTSFHPSLDVALFGGGSLNSFDSKFIGFTWANGTPTAAATNETNGYYNSGGLGDGFAVTLPASTTPQTVTVFVGGYCTGGTLTAALSDGSAPEYVDANLSGPTLSYYGYYTLKFAAASAGQSLSVVWKQTSGTGNVTVYAIAVR